MKFGKTYSEYIDKHARNRLSGCSYVEFKRLKKLLKKCPLQDHGSTPASVASSASVAAASSTSPCELLLSQTTSLTASSADDQTWKMTQKDGPCLDSSTVSSGCPSSCPGEDQESFLRLSICCCFAGVCYTSASSQPGRSLFLIVQSTRAKGRNMYR